MKRIKITQRKGMNKRMKKAIPSDAKLLLVVRNDRVVKHHTIEKALSALRLSVCNNARFILPTPENLEHIRIAETLLYYGVPSESTVNDLLHKKAYVRVPSSTEESTTPISSKAVPMNDNMLLEKHLSNHDIFCVEDIAHIFNQGNSTPENVIKFNAASDLMTSFHLADYRKVHGALLKTSQHMWGWVRRIDSVVKRIA